AGYSGGNRPFVNPRGIELATQPDGKIVVLATDDGFDNFVLRYNDDGSLDSSFGAARSEGKSPGTIGGGLSLAVGFWHSGFRSSFVTTDQFGNTIPSQSLYDPVPTAFVVLPNGRILVTGSGLEIPDGISHVTHTYFLLLQSDGELYQGSSALRGVAIADLDI